MLLLTCWQRKNINLNKQFVDNKFLIWMFVCCKWSPKWGAEKKRKVERGSFYAVNINSWSSIKNSLGYPRSLDLFVCSFIYDTFYYCVSFTREFLFYCHPKLYNLIYLFIHSFISIQLTVWKWCVVLSYGIYYRKLHDMWKCFSPISFK